MANLLFLFPQEKYVKEFRALAEAASSLKKYEGLPATTAYEISKINERLENYRAGGFKIYHAVFSQYGAILKDQISKEITPKPGDVLLPFNITVFDSDHEHGAAYEEFLKIVQFSNPRIIGGFHSGDCVRKAQHAARAVGISPFIDEDLTDRSLSVYDALPIVKGFACRSRRAPAEG
ncbi:MAG: hypothetical protein QXU82_02405 [Candidatus Aenigmatarchaeota archaeon]